MMQCGEPYPSETYRPEAGQRPMRLLVLGIGNALLSDDGAGLHVLTRLRHEAAAAPPSRVEIEYIDGGTVGLALAPLIEDADGVVVLDAMRLGAAPGTVHVHVGAQMDAVVGCHCGTPHEVSLGDLFTAVRLLGRLPARRALIGIEPASLDWGTAPTPAVAAGLPQAARAVQALLHAWSQAGAAPQPALEELSS